MYIIDGKGDKFVFWEDFYFGYYCVDYRNTPHLILSIKELNKKQTKKILRSSLNKQNSDGNVVICLYGPCKEDVKQIEKIKELVSDKVANIREYKRFD